MQSALIKLPAVSFRRIESPFDDTVARTYIAVVQIKDLPAEIEKWRKINPRDPKLTSGVSKKIQKSLENNPDHFLFRNRGITLLVEKALYDNKTNEISLEFIDSTRHGLLDGGHTYRVLQNYIHSANPDELKDVNACVRLEVIEGIENLDDAVEIVLARNTSAQVKSESLEELSQHFEEIKQVLKDKPYAERIAYKEYEIDEKTGEAKDIDIKEILSYLVCFDVDHFDQEKHPIMAYSQKSNVIEHFKNNRISLLKYIPLIPKILELRDTIYRDLPIAYNKAIPNGKFGALTGVIQINNRPKMSNEELAFISGDAGYRIPSAFIYPVLAAFRNLVKIDGDRATWKDEPIKVLHSLDGELAKTVGEQAKEMRNPTKLGKDQATWKLCNNIVRIAVLERGL
jgi:hypothetical protein